MGEKEDIIDALTLCSKIETTAALIYRVFYNKFKDDAEAANLWHKMSLEETEHAAFFETQKKMLEKVPAAFGGLNLALPALKKAEAQIAWILDEAMKDDIDMKKAVKLAYKVELVASEGEHIRAMEVKSPSLSAVFEQVLKETDKHMEEVKILAVKYGIADAADIAS